MVVTQERVRDLEVKVEEDRSSGAVEVPAAEVRTRPPRPTAAVAAGKVGLTARALSLIWLVSMTALYVFEPVPDETSVPLWASIVSTAFLAGLGVTMAGLSMGKKWGLGASAVTAAGGLALAASCPLSGHHAGYWWTAEAALFGALLVATRAARKAEGL
jgi:hypothetical protein